jgi:hypothetical protein
MKDLKKICAIIDAQGFWEKRFVPREIAVVADYFKTCFEVDTKLNKNSKTNLFTTKNVHGLTLRPPISRLCIPITDVKFFLWKLHDKLASTEKPFFGCKNNQFLNLLIEFEIPVIDLNEPDFECPSIRDLDFQQRKIWFCSHHTELPTERKNFICALRKANNLKNWLNGRLIILNLLKRFIVANLKIFLKFIYFMKVKI